MKSEELQKKELIREYHVLLNKLGITPEGKEAIMAGYGVTSSKEMNVVQLSQLCAVLRKKLPAHSTTHVYTEAEIAQTWRRRCTVAIGKALAAKGYIRPDNWQADDWNKIDAVLRRACGCGDRRPTASEMRRVYGEFLRQAKTAEAVAEIMKCNE